MQDEIAQNLYEIVGSKEAYLHAVGREDIDVRMLGLGRPFIMEFINPKKVMSCKDKVS